MRDNVFWRKEASIITQLARVLGISPEEAICVFYSTNSAKLLADPATGLQLMSDGYVLEDLLEEISLPVMSQRSRGDESPSAR